MRPKALIRSALAVVAAGLILSGCGDGQHKPSPLEPAKDASRLIDEIERTRPERILVEAPGTGGQQALRTDRIRLRLDRPKTLRRALVLGEGEELQPLWRFSRKRLRGWVASLAGRIDREPVDARYAYRRGRGRLEIRGGRAGERLRQRRLVRRLEKAIERGLPRVTAEVVSREPAVSRVGLVDRHPKVIVVDKKRSELHLFKKLKRTQTYVVATGAAEYPTPSGAFAIESKQVDPVWSVPDSEWAGDLAGQVIPAGSPQNPLRERWMGVSGPVGIHGTADLSSLGGQASHGCIRMSPEDVIDLYERVEVGTPVIITG